MRSDSRRTRSSSRTAGARRHARPRSHAAKRPSIAISRRQLIAGAAGIAGIALASSGIARLTSKKEEAAEDSSALSVAPDSVFTLSDCTEADASDCMRLVSEFKLPYHTLVWACNDSYASCLVPTSGSAPITKAGILDLDSGSLATVLDGPISSENGYDIYDVRCSSRGIVWTEANAFTGEWRVYHATHSGESIGDPMLADHGTTDYEIPTLAVSEARAFWQVLPSAGTKGVESLLKSSTYGTKGTDIAYRSNGRMATPPYSCDEGVVITPRTKGSAVAYQITLVDGTSMDQRDALVLPASMSPLEAGYANDRFAFSFDAIYNVKSGIANLGTYAPVKSGTPQPGDEWFRFSRNPSAPPAWAGQWLVVKSTKSVSGVDPVNRLVFALDCPDRSDDFGDYLASTGTRGIVATYAHVSRSDTDEYTLLRTWRPLQA